MAKIYIDIGLLSEIDPAQMNDAGVGISDLNKNYPREVF